MKQSGVIYPMRVVEAYSRSSDDVRRWEAIQWKHRISNALWCYRACKSDEEKLEVVRFYAAEFRRLGWRVSE